MTGTLDPAMLERLRQAVLRLPSMTRAVYLMSARDDLAYPEIARRLSISRIEVERHLADALLFLYDEIYGEDEGSLD